jgi:competence protein ComEA
LKTPLKNYFSTTKTEWKGLVIFAVLIIGIVAAPDIYDAFHKDRTINFKPFEQSVAVLKQAGVTSGGDTISELEENQQVVRVKQFKFNPNRLPAVQWQQLGLSVRQVKGIKNYEAKGGKFKTKADVKKMYTLTAEDYARLEPYIELPSATGATKSLVVVELNTADSVHLVQVHGIWPSLAMRIIHYRDRLGGFYSKAQLKEVFGLDDVKYKEIQTGLKVNPRRLKKININKAEFDDLKSFPYLSFKQMNAIIQYRKQHGDYESFSELSNVAILDDSVLLKIKPYCILK